MKKTWLVVPALIIAALLWIWISQREANTPSASMGVEPAVAAPKQAAALTTKHDAPPGARPSEAPSAPPLSAAPAEPPTATEQEILVMYDELVTAFEQHRTSCRQMGIALEALVASHKSALERFRDERAKLTPEQWTAAQERLEHSQGERMQKVRHVIEQSVARCKTNERLRGALRDLAAASSPPS